MLNARNFKNPKFAKLIAFCTVMPIVLFGDSVAFALDPSPIAATSQQYAISSPLEPSSALFSVKQYISFRALGGVNVDRSAASIMDMSMGKMCANLSTTCISSLNQINLNGYFTICKTDADFMCVSNLELKVGANDWQKAEFVREVDYQATPAELAQAKVNIEQHDPFGGTVHDVGIGTSWSARTELGYPGSASGPLVFRVNGLKNAGGSDVYTLQAHYIMNANVGANGIALNPSIQDMSVGLIPTIESVTGHGQTPITATRTDKWGKLGQLAARAPETRWPGKLPQASVMELDSQAKQRPVWTSRKSRHNRHS
jgi:hypothetical protein